MVGFRVQVDGLPRRRWWASAYPLIGSKRFMCFRRSGVIGVGSVKSVDRRENKTNRNSNYKNKKLPDKGEGVLDVAADDQNPRESNRELLQ